jgi:fucose 4-O-acetylase-like acetyltransferase
MSIDRQRIHWIDLLKGYSIFLIVMLHTSISRGLFLYLGSFIIQLFMYLSGYSFRIKEVSFWPFIKNRFLRIMVPYYSFMLISFLIFIGLASFSPGMLPSGGSEQNDQLRLALGILYATEIDGSLIVNRPLWFLPCLFSTDILAYFVLFLKKRTGLAGWAFASTVLLGFFGLLASMGFPYAERLRSLPFGIYSACGMLVFFMLGYWSREYRLWESIDRKTYRLPAGLACLAMGGWLASKNIIVSVMTSTYGNIGIFYISSLLSLTGYLWLGQSLPEIKPLEYIGRNTMPILLMHKFPVLFVVFMANRLPFLNVWYARQSLAFSLATTLLAIMACLIAGLIIGRLFPVILGKTRQRR